MLQWVVHTGCTPREAGFNVKADFVEPFGGLSLQVNPTQQVLLYLCENDKLLLLFFYQYASIYCRTRMLHCSSDTEFLAKLYCVRLAFQVSEIIYFTMFFIARNAFHFS